jgi:hypothetical protein
MNHLTFLVLVERGDGVKIEKMNWVEARAKGEDDGRGEEDEWVSAQAAV